MSVRYSGIGKLNIKRIINLNRVRYVTLVREHGRRKSGRGRGNFR